MAKGEENKNLNHPTQFLQLKSRRNTSNVQQHNDNQSPPKKNPSRSVFCPKSVSSVQMTKKSSLKKKAI